jgi:hypothetical protein
LDPLSVLDKYRIDHVLILDAMPLGFLLQHTPGWHIIKSEKSADGNCLTFARDPLPETYSSPAPADRGSPEDGNRSKK